MMDRSHATSGFLMPGEGAATRLEAPGAPGYHGDMRAPEPNPRPWLPVSDYAVEPESGQEMFHGEVREASPAGPKHSRQHNQVDFVLRAYVAPEYGADTDLLTRQAIPHNFASDTCIRKNGIDPATGDRYLEELAFEIKSTQSTEDLEQRARIMAARGVRRIFAIPVRGDEAGSDILAGPVAEWIPLEERWRTFGDDQVIADPCLFEPVPVRALLDAVEADDAVAQALLHKGNPFLLRHTEAVRAEDRKECIHAILQSRGVAMDAGAHARVAACTDPALLLRWVVRAAHVVRASDLFGDD
jgi:hypothetical protein